MLQADILFWFCDGTGFWGERSTEPRSLLYRPLLLQNWQWDKARCLCLVGFELFLCPVMIYDH